MKTRDELIIQLRKRNEDLMERITVYENELKTLREIEQSYNDLKLLDDNLTDYYGDKILKMKVEWELTQKRYTKTISTLHKQIRKLKSKKRSLIVK